MHHPANIYSFERAARYATRRERDDDAASSTTRRRGRDAEAPVHLQPLTFDERSANELRPATFDQIVGQDRLRRLLRRIVAASQANGRPLDHMMLSGQAGVGKTTLAQVTAHELGRTVYQVKAPVGYPVLEAMQRTCRDGDVVIIDEIHLLVSGDRRGVTQAADPESFYHIMEDRKLPIEGGMLPFPAVTFIGCTTDEGLLPEAFLRRFPLKLTLDPYTVEDMTRLARLNARQLGVTISGGAALMLGRASRRNPSVVNTYVRNALSLGGTAIDERLAEEVVVDLNGCTLDGLTMDMQMMLRYLLSCRRVRRVDNEVIYQASVGSIATRLGRSRDTKAVALFVEPYLIAEGYVAVTHGGRVLTDAGVQRATQL